MAKTTNRMMRGALLAAGAGVAALCLAAAPASAAPLAGCSLSVSSGPATWDLPNYNPFTAAGTTGNFGVTYTNSGGANCNVTVAVQTTAEPFMLAGAAGQLLPYRLSDGIGDVTPILGPTPPSVTRSFTVPAGGLVKVPYAFTVNLANLPTDGTFQQHIEVDVTGDATLTKPVLLQLDVVPSAAMALRGTLSHSESTANVDLGNLTTNGTVNLDLQLFVQSTGGYAVAAQSQNGGVLKLAGSPNWTIAYGMSLGAHTLDLTKTDGFAVPNAKSARQDLLPISFTVGDVSKARAGAYQDVITLSITPS